MKYFIFVITCVSAALLWGCGEKSDTGSNQEKGKRNSKVVPQHHVNDEDRKEVSLDTKPQLPPFNFKSDKPRIPAVQDDSAVPEKQEEELVVRFRDAIQEVGRPGSEKYRSEMTRMWKESLRGNFERPIESLSEESKAGKELPKQVEKLLSVPFFEKDITPFSEGENEVIASRWLTGLATWESFSGGHLLPNLLLETSGKLPPREKDLMILYASLRGIKELNPSTNKPILEEWELLANARNPIYRLIALKASVPSTPKNLLHLSTEDRDYNELVAAEKVQFYKSYLNETDPLILSGLIEAIRIHPSKESISVLEKLKGNPVVDQNEGIQELIEKSQSELRKKEERGAGVSR